MKNNAKRIIALLTGIVMLTALLTSCGAKKDKESNALADISDEMYSAEYWTAKYKKSGDVMLKSDEITKLNTAIVNASTGMEDILAYPAAITGTKLYRYLGEWDAEALKSGVLYNSLGEEVNTPAAYNSDGEVEDEGNTELLDSAIDNTAIDSIADNGDVSYVLAAENTALRRLPTAEALYTSLTSEDDALRIKSVLVGEPMVVLHTSRDLEWVYVQTREARGWVEWSKVVFCDKSTWVSYVRADKFIVVTDAAVTLTAAGKNSVPLTLYMGTVLPVAEETPSFVNGQSSAGCYVVKIPANGGIEQILVPKTAGVSLGWLDYTPDNVVATAFRLMGQKINPAGVNYGWDEGSFYTSVFHCFGIYLPLTTVEQKAIPTTDTELLIESVDGVKKELDKLAPGALLYSDKDAYMYLGSEGGKYYILHPAAEFFVDNTRYSANCVILTSMDIMRADGATYISSLEKIKKLAIAEEK